MQDYFLNNWLWLDLWTFLLFPYYCVLCFHNFAFSKTLLQINLLFWKVPQIFDCFPPPHQTSLCGPLNLFCKDISNVIEYYPTLPNNGRGYFIHLISFYQFIFLKAHLLSPLLFAIFLIPKPDIIARYFI